MPKLTQKTLKLKGSDKAINPLGTQEKIKKAAHQVFLKKGFSATTIRDVAEVAESNLALVNYYFRSKKNLFNIVMKEKIQELLGRLIPILNSESTTLDQKIDHIVVSYIDFLSKNPDLPIFILNEVKKNNFDFVPKVRFDEIIRQSSFMKQLKMESGEVNPVQLFISLLGMTIFPFIARPTILQTGLVKEQDFQKMMQERKTLIPAWIKSMLVMNANR